MVKANHRCVDFTQANDYVEVTCVCNQKNTENIFAHWEMTKLEQTKAEITEPKNSEKTIAKKFRAKLVVAADGINSTIRQLLYNNSDLIPWAKPRYCGIGAIGCLKIDLVPHAQELETKYLQDGRIITLRDDSEQLDKPWIILLHRQENTFGYLLHTPLKKKSEYRSLESGEK